MSNSGTLCGLLSLIVFSIAFFNFAGVSITKHMSATTRKVKIVNSTLWLKELMFHQWQRNIFDKSTLKMPDSFDRFWTPYEPLSYGCSLFCSTIPSGICSFNRMSITKIWSCTWAIIQTAWVPEGKSRGSRWAFTTGSRGAPRLLINYFRFLMFTFSARRTGNYLVGEINLSFR